MRDFSMIHDRRLRDRIRRLVSAIAREGHPTAEAAE
jgi:hypothetical protein